MHIYTGLVLQTIMPKREREKKRGNGRKVPPQRQAGVGRVEKGKLGSLVVGNVHMRRDAC